MINELVSHLRRLWAAVVIALSVVAPVGHAAVQTDFPTTDRPLPQFEVASVKPSARGTGGSRFDLSAPSSVVITNATLQQLLVYAYDLRATQILDLPDWGGFPSARRFDVVATFSEGASSQERRLMMRDLLRERFGLQATMEVREQEAYQLTLVAPDGTIGSDLRPSQHDCAAFLAAGGDARDAEAPRDSLGRPLCTSTMTVGGVIRIVFGGAPISELAERLETFTERPVIDRTGLVGRFDIELAFLRDEVPADWVPDRGVSPPRLFPALEEQLGLRLEPRVLPVEVLVVHSVALPTQD